MAQKKAHFVQSAGMMKIKRLECKRLEDIMSAQNVILVQNFKENMEKVKTTSESIGVDNIGKLSEVFPNFVKDGQVDFDALKVFFEKEGKLPEGQEKYGLNWAGKSNAFKLIKTPATGTLVPDEEESKKFDKTENLFIEGDNLEVLKLLQKHYREQIKMIYIDPPYNTGKDFIYKDNFTEDKSDYYERTGQNSGGIPMTTNRDSSGRYHSDWLTMMYPRLFLARNLLKEDGVIFISIDDNEVANLRLIMDEIFGEENFVTTFIWEKRVTRENRRNVSIRHDYILCYTKSNEEIANAVGRFKMDEAALNRYSNPDNDPRGQWTSAPATAQAGHATKSQFYELTTPSGRKLNPPGGRCWLYTQSRMNEEIAKNNIWFGRDGQGVPRIKTFLNDGSQGLTPETILLAKEVGTNDDAKRELKELFKDVSVFDTPKPPSLIQKLMEVGNIADGDIILDFFAGSGPTAHAVMNLNAEDGGNRKWICVQLPEMTDDNSEARKAGFENIAQIARERIRRASKKIAEKNEKKLPLDKETDTTDLDIGFKAYALSKSSYRQWNTITDKDDEVTLTKQAKLFAEKPLVDNFAEKSVVYEILLKEGFNLNSGISEFTNNRGLHFWIVKGGIGGDDISHTMFVTFASKVVLGDADEHNLGEGDLFVCLDSALDDTTKINILRRKFSVKVI